MLKRKAFNRIFLTTVIFFLVFAFYSLNKVNNEIEYKKDNHKASEEVIYTLNKNNYVSKTSVYVSKMLTLEDKIKEKLEIMIDKNNKNSLLPSYFKPILPQNTKVLDVVVEDSLVKVYFSKELGNITKEQSEKMIEAIVYTITNENILGVEIYVDGSMLRYVPHTKKELPTILSKEIGINKSYEVSSQNDITKVVMMYYASESDNYYEVPVTKYMNDKREKVEIIFDNLTGFNKNTDLINLFEGVKVNSYKILSNKIIIDINRELNDKEKNLLTKAIFLNYDVKKVEILVNGKKYFEKYEKGT